MILTAHQPVYLPWLGFFNKLSMADSFCWFDDVQYCKKDWISRNRVKTPQGVQWLTVPVKSKGHLDKKIKDVEINNEVPWRRKHWRTILFAYGKAKYAKTYLPLFEYVYSREWIKLSSLNEYLIRYLLQVLETKVEWFRASELGFKGHKSDLVLDMCERLGADSYIFGTHGKDYANIDKFKNSGVSVVFQEYQHPVYDQLWGEFTPNLSVIDLLFNCGGESGRIIRND